MSWGQKTSGHGWLVPIMPGGVKCVDGDEISGRKSDREARAPGGHLLIEIGPAIHEAVQQLLKSDARFEPGPTIKDLTRLPRVVRAQRLR